MSAAGLEIVVVAYGSPDPLEACLATLGNGWNTLVVDNSSSPATREVAERHGAKYIDPGRNLGFAAGVNRGLRARLDCEADVLLLNPDATITPDQLRLLHKHLLEDPKLACVAPAQVDPADGASARVCWPRPTPRGAWIDALGLGSLRKACGFLIGSVLLLRGGALDDIGWLDERFFLYTEEADWQIRAQERGWKIALCTDVTATHVGAGTGGDPTKREVHFHAAHEKLIRKHYGPAGWQVFRAAGVVGAAVRAVLPPAERAARARFRLHLYLTGPCRAEHQYIASGSR